MLWRHNRPSHSHSPEASLAAGVLPPWRLAKLVLYLRGGIDPTGLTDGSLTSIACCGVDLQKDGCAVGRTGLAGQGKKSPIFATGGEREPRGLEVLGKLVAGGSGRPLGCQGQPQCLNLDRSLGGEIFLQGFFFFLFIQRHKIPRDGLAFFKFFDIAVLFLFLGRVPSPNHGNPSAGCSKLDGAGLGGANVKYISQNVVH